MINEDQPLPIGQIVQSEALIPESPIEVVDIHGGIALAAAQVDEFVVGRLPSNSKYAYLNRELIAARSPKTDAQLLKQLKGGWHEKIADRIGKTGVFSINVREGENRRKITLKIDGGLSVNYTLSASDIEGYEFVLERPKITRETSGWVQSSGRVIFANQRMGSPSSYRPEWISHFNAESLTSLQGIVEDLGKAGNRVRYTEELIR